MRILLDTHIFLWFISGDPRLPTSIQQAIRNPANNVFLSSVSIWEAIVKHQIGKLPLPQPPELYLPFQRQRHGIASLALDEQSVLRLAQLPPLHRDPFDRMLVCQAMEHAMSLASTDPAVRAYPVALLA